MDAMQRLGMEIDRDASSTAHPTNGYQVIKIQCQFIGGLGGQGIANGTRSAPSYPLNWVERHGPAEPWTAVSKVMDVSPALSDSGPLSAVKM